MEANELRIGNLVYETFYSSDDPKDQNYNRKDIFSISDIHEYHGYDISDAGYMGGIDGKSLKYLSPIPLTEEWLEKFGFKKWGKYNMLKHKGFTIYPQFDKYFFYSNALPEINIHYVHELQNLYYALTKTELTIKS